MQIEEEVLHGGMGYCILLYDIKKLVTIWRIKLDKIISTCPHIVLYLLTLFHSECPSLHHTVKWLLNVETSRLIDQIWRCRRALYFLFAEDSGKLLQLFASGVRTLLVWPPSWIHALNLSEISALYHLNSGWKNKSEQKWVIWKLEKSTIFKIKSRYPGGRKCLREDISALSYLENLKYVKLLSIV